jgi:hypothetical protein
VSFSEPLEAAVSQATGGVGAAFVDGEGETIESVSLRGRDFIRLIGAHQGIILAMVRRAHEKLGTGDAVKSLSIRSGEYIFSIVPVLDDTFLVLAQDRTGITAQGVEVLTRAAAIIRDEI